jgi:penicillin-binding protein 2
MSNMSNMGKRSYLMYGLLLLVGIVFLYKFYTLQLKSDAYLIQAQRNGSTEVPLYPVRGTIYDRNDKLIVFNDFVYDLAVIPIKAKHFDTIVLCNLLEITQEELITRIEKAAKYSTRKPTTIAKNLSVKAYSAIQENLYRYPGFVIENKTDRRYKTAALAHVLGYVSEASEELIKENPYYKMADLVGVTGIEKSYEEELRGVKGYKIMMVDKFNLQKGSFADGKFDTKPIPGQDLVTSIDLDIQLMAEEFLKNKTGSIVAIEPKTGEILCLANSPAYDPNELTGPERNKNFRKLLMDPKKPLYNRALKAPYPPGSTFKTVQALIGMQEEVLVPETRYPCFGGYRLGNRKVGCHAHPSPADLKYSIQTSCNAYYCYVFKSIVDNPKYKNVSEGLNAWVAHLNTFGIGVTTNVDIAGENKGYIPTPERYQKVFGKNWKSSNVISIAIGQGEVGLTPIQMANMCAIIANKGYYVRPHVVKYIGKDRTKVPDHLHKNYTSVERQYYDIVYEAMASVYKPGGTAFWTAIPGLELCGKTGTAQNPHGKDHSVFIGFGPKENPQIAVAILIENGGFGATWAAPMASLIMEKYITRKEVSAKPEMYQRMLLPVK